MKDKELGKLHEALQKITKHYGKDVVVDMTPEDYEDLRSVSTGSIALDTKLRIGGFPEGRIIEIFGPESSGKSTLGYHTLKNVQAKGGRVAIIDMEYTFTREYGEMLGMNVDEILLFHPDCGEEALEITENLVSSGEVRCIMIDSVAALVPKAEIEGEMGDSKMGLQARLMSQALRKLTAKASKNNCMLIFINQTRQKIGVVYGNPETTAGGTALKFYASVRIRMSRKEVIKDGGDIAGYKCELIIIKSKVGPAGSKVSFDMLYGEGISRIGEIIDLSMELGLIYNKGPWYYYDGTQIGQGKDAVKNMLEDNPELEKELTDKIMSALQTKIL